MKRGFTLIELLVVISIIAILAAMLMPVIGLVRDQAKAANCLSNLRQIAMAHLAYAQENEELIPTLKNGAPPEPDEKKFNQYLPLWDSTMNRPSKVWRCTEPRLLGWNGGWWKYYFNWWTMLPISEGGAPNYHRATPYRMPEVRKVSEAAICADFDTGAKGGYHRNRTNTAFLDGHAAGIQDPQGRAIWDAHFAPNWSTPSTPVQGWDK